MVTKINTSTNHQNSSQRKYHSKTAITFCIFILAFFVTQCSNPELDIKECKENKDFESCERVCDRGSGLACYFAGKARENTPNFVEIWFIGYGEAEKYKQVRPFFSKIL